MGNCGRTSNKKRFSNTKVVLQKFVLSPYRWKIGSCNKTNTTPAESGEFLVSSTKVGLSDGLAGQIDPVKTKIRQTFRQYQFNVEVVLNEIFDAKTRNLKIV
jgi:hypothetical protein